MQTKYFLFKNQVNTLKNYFFYYYILNLNEYKQIIQKLERKTKTTKKKMTRKLKTTLILNWSLSGTYKLTQHFFHATR